MSRHDTRPTDHAPSGDDPAMAATRRALRLAKRFVLDDEMAAFIGEREKKYTTIRAGCDRLFEAARRDQITCSGGCRVRAHRNGEIKRLKEIAKQHGVGVASLLHASAIGRMRPDLEAPIGPAFDGLVMKAVMALPEDAQ
jgi:hypothetical protein